ICVAVVLMMFLCLQAVMWPWKVPLINLLDCWLGFCIILLVISSSLHLDHSPEQFQDFAQLFSTVVMSLIGGALFLMAFMTLTALALRSVALGGNQDLAIFNLGRSPPTALVVQKLQETAEELISIPRENLAKALDGLGVLDSRKITDCLTLLSTEFTSNPAKFRPRITSSSFTGISNKFHKVEKAAPKAAPDEALSNAIQPMSNDPAQLEAVGVGAVGAQMLTTWL
ncbi:unnamed protein product, partial [Effrenium voratum]